MAVNVGLPLANPIGVGNLPSCFMVFMLFHRPFMICDTVMELAQVRFYYVIWLLCMGMTSFEL